MTMSVVLHRRQFVNGLLAVAVTGLAGCQAVPEMGDEYGYTIVCTHTQREFRVTSKAGFDSALRDWRENKPVTMAPELYALANRLVASFKAPRILLVSGYRTPDSNRLVRSRDSSFHPRRMAMDVIIPGVPAERVRDAAVKLKLGGVGFYPAGRKRKKDGEFTHVDCGPVHGRKQRRRVWVG